MRCCSAAVVTRHSHTQGWPGAGGGGREEVGGAAGEVQQRRLLHHRLVIDCVADMSENSL